MSHRSTRRSFLQSTAVAGVALPFAAPAILKAAAPNEKVRVAAVGVGGKGWSDLLGAAAYADVVAFCDVETGKPRRRGGFGAAAKRYPKARRYTDWRVMFDKEKKNIDAVTISTPDHMHAPVTMTALQRGIATYTQKPLTRTIHEARALTLAAKKHKVITQMGNQGHSGIPYRTVVALVQSGAIGKIKVAHAWSNRPIWPQGIDRPKGSDPIPKSLNWDHWLGVAEARPYKNDVYHAFKWRGWYDFGAGALGDMGCHIIDPVVWSCDLGAPLSVSYKGPAPNPETFPKNEVLTYRFPGTKFTAGKQLKMTWYDGGKLPAKAGSHLPKDVKLPKNGILLIGETGSLLCRHGGSPRLYPEDLNKKVAWKKFEKQDHYRVWIDGIRDNEQPSSNFGYAGPLTETVLLGVIASRVGAGELKWDAKALKFTNSDIANRYVKEDYRKGWEVEGL